MLPVIRDWGQGVRRAPGWLLAALLWLTSGTSAAADACLKRIFNHYCLGGDVQVQLAQPPPPLFQQPEGDRLAVVYQEGRERTYVMAFRGRIYKVVREYYPATQVTFDDLYTLLRSKYGEGEDRSRFPSYARTPSSRLGAIRRGDGRAMHRWDVPQDGYHMELAWNREQGLTLAYLATDLGTQVGQVLDQGL